MISQFPISGIVTGLAGSGLHRPAMAIALATAICFSLCEPAHGQGVDTGKARGLPLYCGNPSQALRRTTVCLARAPRQPSRLYLESKEPRV
jgi:hypothetical protein